MRILDGALDTYKYNDGILTRVDLVHLSYPVLSGGVVGEESERWSPGSGIVYYSQSIGRAIQIAGGFGGRTPAVRTITSQPIHGGGLLSSVVVVCQ